MEAAFSEKLRSVGDQIPRLCLLLGRAEREVRRSLAAGLEHAELTVDEFLLLAACDTAELPGQTDLNSTIGVSAAQTSTLLERLRKRNLLNPERDNADRRRQVWSLTPVGRECLRGAWLTLEPTLLGLVARLPDTANDLVTKTLEALASPGVPERRRCA